MPNQIFEWVGPRQRFCTHCHYDNFLGTPTATYSLPSLVSGCQVALVVSIARRLGSPDGASCCLTA